MTRHMTRDGDALPIGLSILCAGLRGPQITPNTLHNTTPPIPSIVAEFSSYNSTRLCTHCTSHTDTKRSKEKKKKDDDDDD